jgi:hypothetical protein
MDHANTHASIVCRHLVLVERVLCIVSDGVVCSYVNTHTAVRNTIMNFICIRQRVVFRHLFYYPSILVSVIA